MECDRMRDGDSGEMGEMGDSGCCDGVPSSTKFALELSCATKLGLDGAPRGTTLGLELGSLLPWYSL